jgi:hypothetical protein
MALILIDEVRDMFNSESDRWLKIEVLERGIRALVVVDRDAECSMVMMRGFLAHVDAH